MVRLRFTLNCLVFFKYRRFFIKTRMYNYWYLTLFRLHNILKQLLGFVVFCNKLSPFGPAQVNLRLSLTEESCSTAFPIVIYTIDTSQYIFHWIYNILMKVIVVLCSVNLSPFTWLMLWFCFNVAAQNPTSDSEPIDKDMIWAQLLSCRSAGYVTKPLFHGSLQLGIRTASHQFHPVLSKLRVCRKRLGKSEELKTPYYAKEIWKKFLGLGVPSILIRHQERAFQNRSLNPRNFKACLFVFVSDGEHFEKKRSISNTVASR